ncbi:MAG: hypothetical protein VX597_00075 [Pseudomonadota bacterium]|nr:hypothetical protein [Pseudomonadota bacterium]
MKTLALALVLGLFTFAGINPFNDQNRFSLSTAEAGPDGRFTLKCKKPATWRLPNGKCCKRGMKKKKCIREYRKQAVIDATAASKACGVNISGRCQPKYDAVMSAEAKKYCGAKKGPFGGGNCRAAFGAGWYARGTFNAAMDRK